MSVIAIRCVVSQELKLNKNFMRKDSKGLKTDLVKPRFVCLITPLIGYLITSLNVSMLSYLLLYMINPRYFS
jgi:hypothetical protein